MGAPTFKEIVAADISAVFLNQQEFADLHNIDGRDMAVVVDENELLERDKAKMLGARPDGIYTTRRLIYVAKADFGGRPAQGSVLVLDGRPFRVQVCTEEAGVLAIELEVART